MSDDIEEILMSLAGVVDGDEPVDELSHALQCAGHALAASASPAIVAAALFHDVARSPLVACEFPGVPHEVAAATWLRPVFGERVAWLAGAHVGAKLHLLDNDPGYRDSLTEESVQSSVSQRSSSAGLPQDNPWRLDALQLRHWDDAAKDPAAALPDPRDVLRITRTLHAR